MCVTKKRWSRHNLAWKLLNSTLNNIQSFRAKETQKWKRNKYNT